MHLLLLFELELSEKSANIYKLCIWSPLISEIFCSQSLANGQPQCHIIIEVTKASLQTVNKMALKKIFVPGLLSSPKYLIMGCSDLVSSSSKSTERLKIRRNIAGSEREGVAQKKREEGAQKEKKRRRRLWNIRNAR